MIEIRRPWNASNSAVSDFLVTVSGVNITCDNTQFPSADENLSNLYLLIKEDAPSASSQVYHFMNKAIFWKVSNYFWKKDL